MAKRRIAGSRALVTGASSGIGRALALALAEAGADAVLLARNREKLDQIAADVRARGRTAFVCAGDVTHPACRSAAITAARSELGGLDILINNAGVSAHGRFAQAGEERLRQIMEVNFFAAAELTRAAIPLLQEGRQPIVVNIGSILGHRGVPYNTEYCASKFALRGWTEALRPELARLGIDVLLVSPGTTDTKFFEHLIEKQGDTPWRKSKGVSPQAVAAATIRAIRRDKHEIIPSLPGRMLQWLNRISPRLVDRIMRRYG